MPFPLLDLLLFGRLSITNLALGISIGLVLAALGYILTRNGQAHAPEETTTNDHQEGKE